MLYLFNVGCSSTWGGETGSPPLMSIDFFFLNRGFFGGRGIARPPSSSHPRCVHQHCRRVLRRRKDWHLSLPPHNVEVFFGGGGIGPPPHNVRYVRRLLVGCAGQPSLGVALYARPYEVDRGQDRRHVGTLRRLPSVWLGMGQCSFGTLRRYHGLWDGLRLAHGYRISATLGTLL